MFVTESSAVKCWPSKKKIWNISLFKGLQKIRLEGDSRSWCNSTLRNGRINFNLRPVLKITHCWRSSDLLWQRFNYPYLEGELTSLLAIIIVPTLLGATAVSQIPSLFQKIHDVHGRWLYFVFSLFTSLSCFHVLSRN